MPAKFRLNSPATVQAKFARALRVSEQGKQGVGQ
jgi:hypothetical protein